MKKPLRVRQSENVKGEYWFIVKAPNGATLATSEMYPTRSNAKRAARAFIKAVDPVQVEFSYWSGPTRNRLTDPNYRLFEELIR